MSTNGVKFSHRVKFSQRKFSQVSSCDSMGIHDMFSLPISRKLVLFMHNHN